MKDKLITTAKGVIIAALFGALVYAAGAFAASKDDEIENPSELGETYVGDVVADAMKAALGADAALAHGGSLGFDALPEKITDKTVSALVPFDTDMVVAVKLKGDAVRRILEKSCSLLPRRSSTFLQVSGMSFTCDLNQSPGKRVSGVKIGGKALAADKDYVVAVTEYLSSGGGGMKEFREGKVVSEEGTPIGEVVLKNSKYDKKKIDQPEGRITIIPAAKDSE